MGWSSLCCVFCFIILSIEHVAASSSDSIPTHNFANHKIIKPRFYYGREKREISSNKKEDGYIHDITVEFSVHGKEFILDLHLNRDLIPKTYFEKFQQDGDNVVNRPTDKDVQLCHYQGKLRGVANSWAAVSTCYGLNGVVFDGQEMIYLERMSKTEDHCYFYKNSDFNTNYTCGASGREEGDATEDQEFHKILRHKRGTQEIRGPYNADMESRYIELLLVVDNGKFRDMGENLAVVQNHCKEIANVANALFAPLNIFIALVGVIVWTERDEISISQDAEVTLSNFLRFRRENLTREHPNDNAQLITGKDFLGGVVGKSLLGPICTDEYSGGVCMYSTNLTATAAINVAHQLGHNLGMMHDEQDCQCPEIKCIMAPSFSYATIPRSWSSCSKEYLQLAFKQGMDYCLRNKPERLFDGPVCGNGFVESGEECDCGLEEQCDNPCCNATSCMLSANATCATGECCNITTCELQSAGVVCRSAEHQCDLSEFCTGQSEFCPDDVFRMNGESCNGETAFCYHGSCSTHSDQCQLLWGPTGEKSDDKCYAKNTAGNRYGNCGYDNFNHSYFKCDEEDLLCGRLQCKHMGERLEFGMEAVSFLSALFIASEGNIISCRSAIVDLGLTDTDPGLVPDGAKCGDGKMCINQKCVDVAEFQQNGCIDNCNGNGVCNSKGHCHCDVGFSPPFCNSTGAGGSEDSGPVSGQIFTAPDDY